MSAVGGALISAILPRVLDTVDKAVEDKSIAVRLRADIVSEMLRSESQITAAASNVVMAEAAGESWLQRNWRPILMMWFAFLIGAYWFGFVPVGMPETVIQDLFTLVQIGVGGYVIGRSGEKIARTVAPYLGDQKGP